MRQRGVTLIELVIFLVILGLLGAGILSAMSVGLQTVPDVEKTAIAADLAQQRMEAIVSERDMNGFSSTVDPCDATPSLPFCAVAAGYTVETTISSDWGGDINFKVVTIKVLDSSNNNVLATLTRIVANFV